VPSTKAHRLIARANREGLIRVFVEGAVAECVALEETLKAAYRIEFCEVVPDLDEGPLPLRTLGIAGARYLRSMLDHSEHRIIASAMAAPWPRRSTICRAASFRPCSSCPCSAD
jgi:DNA-binding transcriptional regulator LsrR (DeoR family)